MARRRKRRDRDDIFTASQASTSVVAFDAAPLASRASFSFQAPAQTSHDRYDRFVETSFVSVRERPLSTFSIDVDTASYSKFRRFLQEGARPPRGAVRIEEMLDYFRYANATPDRAASDERPIAVGTELSVSPWERDHRLVRVAIPGRPLPVEDLPVRNLVLLVDVSGSTEGPDRLPWVKRGLVELVEHLRPQDRVVLATDGDFNVGVTSRSELVDLIERESESSVFLSVLGFGRGNLNDSSSEELADHGNGNYAYVDSPAEARRVLVHESGATLVTIARDVTIQAEFNPAKVQADRLIGYENRRLTERDFTDDEKDAGGPPADGALRDRADGRALRVGRRPVEIRAAPGPLGGREGRMANGRTPISAAPGREEPEARTGRDGSRKADRSGDGARAEFVRLVPLAEELRS